MGLSLWELNPTPLCIIIIVSSRASFRNIKYEGYTIKTFKVCPVSCDRQINVLGTPDVYHVQYTCRYRCAIFFIIEKYYYNNNIIITKLFER
jgi:hypothetical protein